ALAGAGIGAATGGILGALVGLGIPEEEAGHYAESVRRGGTLVTVKTDDHRLDEAEDILSRHGTVDIDTRVADWRDEGWAGFEAEGSYETYDPEFREHYNRAYAGNGGDGDAGYARFIPAYRYGYVLATDASYRDYSDWNDLSAGARRDWDPAYGDWNEFEGSVRHAWERVKGGVRQAGDDIEDFFDPDDDYFNSYASRYRSHYDTHYATSAYPYASFDNAYHYGYALGTYDRYDDYDSWEELEPNARRDWERNYDEPWDDIKGAVRHAWEDVTNAAEDAWNEVTDPIDGRDNH
ncbi:MAG: hypothetical protein ACRDHL_03735, partial [Candidatus Promineifilaceae bacterium]